MCDKHIASEIKFITQELCAIILKVKVTADLFVSYLSLSKCLYWTYML